MVPDPFSKDTGRWVDKKGSSSRKRSKSQVSYALRYVGRVVRVSRNQTARVGNVVYVNINQLRTEHELKHKITDMYCTRNLN